MDHRLRELDIELVVARTAEDALSILDEELDAEAKEWVCHKQKKILAFLYFKFLALPYAIRYFLATL